MIECSDKITFYKKEYVEINDIYIYLAIKS